MSLQDILVNIQSGVSQGGTGITLVAAAVILIVLVVAGVAVYVSYAFSPRGRIDALLGSRTRTKRNPWPLRGVIVALLICTPIALSYYASRPSTCARCHDTTAQTRLNKTAHRKLECMQCHGSPGVMGPLNNQISYAGWTWAYYVENRKTTTPVLVNLVDSEKCLRCHSSVLSGVSQNNGIRVRHSDFLSQGASCGECHDDVAHSDPATVVGPSMKACVSCHDGKKAPSECKTCHIQDIAISQSTVSEMQTQRIKISGSYNVCYSCHDPKPCLRCHGVMMPHPPGWGPSNAATSTGGSGTHPLEGFTNREACFRCHFAPGQPFVGSNASCTCHGFLGTMHGGPVWVKEHGLEASGQKTGQLSNCSICHVVPDFCMHCHPQSIMSKYKPIGSGPDNYTRQYNPTPQEQVWINGL